jgi:alpha-1,3-rhamnosyl/mannosyltransferase
LGADLYHSPYYLMPYWVKIPTLLTVHDVIPLVYPAYSSVRARLLFRVAMTLALRSVAWMTVDSQSTLQDLRNRFHVDASRVSVVPAAPDPIFYPRPEHAVAEVRRRYELPEHFALYLGSNKPHKNLTRLIEAWAKVIADQPEAVLVVAGHWIPEHDEPQVRARALGLEASNLRWLGPIPGDDLPLLYTAATLFVFPSLYEGFGLPPLEAMACGTPVACSNVSSLPEVVGDAAVTFDPTKVSSIAEALIRLWTHSHLLMDLWARGIRQAQRFSWEAAARRTLDLYREMTDANRSQGSAGTQGFTVKS